VVLLNLAPLFRQETFKEILPAYESLGLGGLLDFHFLKVIAGEEATAPPGQVVEESSLQVWMGSGLHQRSRELGHAFGQHLIGSLGLTA